MELNLSNKVLVAIHSTCIYFNFRYIPAHLIAQSLGPNRCLALPIFHALTGCDQVSSFYGHGKKSAWSVWEANQDLTEHLVNLAKPDATHRTVEHAMNAIEKFTVLLYNVQDNTVTSLDEARHFLVHSKSYDFEKLPPTLDALKLHVMRSTHQVRWKG